ncbi:MAG TPA: YtxH domain-containing protein [Thermoflexia bacterium]|nr:YtxH domain-containing protein [Thermoflexia bacterium]
MVKESSFGAFVTGFFIGGLIGSGAALLFAPQAGEKTREQIHQKGIELGEQATKATGEARSKATEKMTEVQVKLEKVTKDLQKRAQELEEQGRVLLAEKQQQIQELTKKVEEQTPAKGITLEDVTAKK